MKALVICKEVKSGAKKGAPDLSVPMAGWVHVGEFPGPYSAYIVTGTEAQLTAVEADKNCMVAVALTDSGEMKFPEMEQALHPSIRGKMNSYLATQGKEPLGADVTLKEVVQIAAPHFQGNGDFDVYDIEGS